MQTSFQVFQILVFFLNQNYVHWWYNLKKKSTIMTCSGSLAKFSIALSQHWCDILTVLALMSSRRSRIVWGISPQIVYLQEIPQESKGIGSQDLGGQLMCPLHQIIQFWNRTHNRSSVSLAAREAAPSRWNHTIQFAP